jgi:hypothetical protein
VLPSRGQALARPVVLRVGVSVLEPVLVRSAGAHGSWAALRGPSAAAQGAGQALKSSTAFTVSRRWPSPKVTLPRSL